MKTMREILCTLGLHQWENRAGGKCDINKDRYRKCIHCSRLEMFDDFSISYVKVQEEKTDWYKNYDK